MSMELKKKILNIIGENSRLSAEEVAAMLGETTEAVAEAISEMEKDGIIGGYHTMINWDRFEGEDRVTAQIGVKIAPVRGEGFDRIAARISKFEEVNSVYLMSGSSYDLILLIEGESMKDIAHFVYDKIAPMDSVVSTATYFVMKKYKDHNVIFESEKDIDERMQVVL
ncbi:MAG: Lrp/AsnC family transcriptional regulator [Eubacterium sp.]|nr:Lrp/AsnC family transcriptional regulator [Eubacterium sp.]SEF76169.1 DNA-binding transcriptional regulator, Lrp family [Eubacterium ruminantium]